MLHTRAKTQTQKSRNAVYDDLCFAKFMLDGYVISGKTSTRSFIWDQFPGDFMLFQNAIFGANMGCPPLALQVWDQWLTNRDISDFEIPMHV